MRINVHNSARALALGFSMMAMAAATGAAAQGEVRIAMTAGDIPRTTGVPDSGFEGYRFVGYTMYEGLINWDLSPGAGIGDLAPALATNWEIDPEDDTRWIFTLREGVTFHDGSAFDADAVIWNLEKSWDEEAPHFDPNQAGVRSRAPLLNGWEKIDDYTIALTTSEPDAWLPWQLTFIVMSSPAQWQAVGGWEAFAFDASGTGPFRMEEYVPRERLVLVPNEDYWNADRMAQADRIVLLPMPEATTRTAALLSGDVHWIEAPAPDAMARMESQGMEIVYGQTPHTWPYQLSFEEGSPWLDLRVRQAANLAVDRDGIQALLGGLMNPAVGTVPPDHAWYGEPEFEISYDPDRARALLAEAGYGPDNPVEITALISTSGSGQMQPLAMNEYIQQTMADVGIELSFEVLEWENLFTNWREGVSSPSSAGAHTTNVSFGWMDPFAAFYRFMHSSQVPPTGFNWGGAGTEDLDALLDRARSTFDEEEQTALLAEFHGKMVDQALWVWVAHDVSPRAMSPQVEGFTHAPSWFQDLTPVHLPE